MTAKVPEKDVVMDDDDDGKDPPPLDEEDVQLLRSYGLGPYSESVKKLEKDITAIAKQVNEMTGVKESDTGLAPPAQWDLVADKQAMQEEQPLQVCTIICGCWV